MLYCGSSTEDEGYDEQHQEYEEEDLSYACCSTGDTAKAKYSGDQCDYEENNGIP